MPWFFAGLFFHRLGVLDRLRFQRALPNASAQALSERNTYMNIFQSNRKIGFSRTAVTREETGVVIAQTVFMRINTMGMVHSIRLNTEGRLNPDMTLVAFSFKLGSGRFNFSARGSVEADRIVVRTQGVDGERTLKIPLESPPYLAAGIYDTLWAAGAEPGTRRVIPVFDPASMGQEPVTAVVLGTEEIEIMGRMVTARRIGLDFKGVHQEAWVGENGEVLREIGFLGITMEKTDRQTALYSLPVEASDDMTQMVSIAADADLSDAPRRQRLQLAVEGIDTAALRLDGGRQRLEGNILTIEKESIENLTANPAAVDASVTPEHRMPTPFIQSDHPRIADLSEKIVAGAATPLERVERLMGWIGDNIEQRPVVSMPDALATLENRAGDCNEHAVLLAAMARAAGIPTEIEAGLVFLRGRFFYHAWNRVFLGQWITVDALFGQIPADVSHVRLAVGSPDQQLDLMSVIGRIKLRVIS